jgi:hypothetical protein
MVTAVLAIFVWQNLGRTIPKYIHHAIWHMIFCALHVAALVIWFENLQFVISFQIVVFCLAELYTLRNLFRSANRARPIMDSSVAFRITIYEHCRWRYSLDPRHLMPLIFKLYQRAMWSHFI